MDPGDGDNDDLTSAEIDLELWNHKKVEGLRLGPHELAAKLREIHATTTLAEGLSGLQEHQRVLDEEEDVRASWRTTRAVNSTSPGYFLTVKDTTVQVVYGVKWCQEVHATQIRLVALMGDQRQVGNAVREPRVVMLTGTPQAQREIFGGFAYPEAKSLTDIIEELEQEGSEDNLADPDRRTVQSRLHLRRC